MLRSGVFSRLSVGARMLSGLARTVSPLAPPTLRLTSIAQTISRMQTLRFPQQPWTSIIKPGFSVPAEESEAPEDNTLHMDSVLRKRRLKMKKHKLRKRRRNQRALKKRLGKI